MVIKVYILVMLLAAELFVKLELIIKRLLLAILIEKAEVYIFYNLIFTTIKVYSSSSLSF